MIRQKQYRGNALPSYLDQIMEAQTHSILRAGEAQQDYRGGLILTLKHPACSSYIIFSLPAVPLVSLSLLESPCRLPVSLLHQSSVPHFIFKASRGSVRACSLPPLPPYSVLSQHISPSLAPLHLPAAMTLLLPSRCSLPSFRRTTLFTSLVPALRTHLLQLVSPR